MKHNLQTSVFDSEHGNKIQEVYKIVPLMKSHIVTIHLIFHMMMYECMPILHCNFNDENSEVTINNKLSKVNYVF